MAVAEVVRRLERSEKDTFLRDPWRTGSELVVHIPNFRVQTGSGRVWQTPHRGAERLCGVSQGGRTVKLVKDGHTVLSMAARFGATRTPTRTGTFLVYWKDIDHVSSLYGSPMPFSMFFSGGQAIHYSSDFARNGYAGRSHGCLNTRDWTATRTLFNSVGIGTRLIVY